MIRVKLIGKIRNKQGKIVSYKLMDDKGLIRAFDSDILKEHIRNKELEVDGLTLTSDNRLITVKTQIKEQDNNEKILNRAKLLGLEIIELRTRDGKMFYMIYKTDRDVMVYIPSNVTNMEEYGGVYNRLRNFTGRIEMVGGKNVKKMGCLFSHSKAKEIDFSQFESNKVTDVSYLFDNTYTKRIKMTNVNLPDNNTLGKMFSAINSIVELNKESYQILFNTLAYEIKRKSKSKINILTDVMNNEEAILRVTRKNGRIVVKVTSKTTDLLQALLNLRATVENIDYCFIDIAREINGKPAEFKERASEVWDVSIVSNKCRLNIDYSISKIIGKEIYIGWFNNNNTKEISIYELEEFFNKELEVLQEKK